MSALDKFGFCSKDPLQVNGKCHDRSVVATWTVDHRGPRRPIRGDCNPGKKYYW